MERGRGPAGSVVVGPSKLDVRGAREEANKCTAVAAKTSEIGGKWSRERAAIICLCGAD